MCGGEGVHCNVVADPDRLLQDPDKNDSDP